MAEFEKDLLTEKIIGCCFEVHKGLGPGFLEKVYSKALQHQLQLEGLSFEIEKEFNLYFKDKLVGHFRCDFFIEKRVIIEIKIFYRNLYPCIISKTSAVIFKGSKSKNRTPYKLR
jgi:GxxExxY protein